MPAMLCTFKRAVTAVIGLLLIASSTCELTHAQSSSGDGIRALKKEMMTLCKLGDLAGVEKAMQSYEKSWLNKSPGIYAYATQFGIQQLTFLADRNNAEAKQMRDKYAKQLISKRMEKHVSYELIEVQMTVFVQVFGYTPLPTNKDLLKEARLERVKMMLKLWDRVAKLKSAYSEFNMYRPGPNWQIPLYRPPASFSGTFIHGMSPDNIKDPKIRVEYISYLKRRAQFGAGCLVRDAAEKTDKLLSYHAPRLISQWYKGQTKQDDVLSLIDKIISDSAQAKKLKASLR